MKLSSVCVFCGSRPGDDPRFKAAAATLGRRLGERKITLVYGGAKVGIMGVLADAALAAGGRVVGVIPRALVSKEVAHDGLAELFVTETMHDRKNRMITLADAFVALPGGFGTYDELFETVTLAQLGIQEKPTGLLDVAGYYAPLVALVKHTIARGFAASPHEEIFVVDDDPDALLDRLARWTPPASEEKWIR